MRCWTGTERKQICNGSDTRAVVQSLRCYSDVIYCIVMKIGGCENSSFILCHLYGFILSDEEIGVEYGEGWRDLFLRSVVM
jgi:hypothetical protein